MLPWLDARQGPAYVTPLDTPGVPVVGAAPIGPLALPLDTGRAHGRMPLAGSELRAGPMTPCVMARPLLRAGTAHGAVRHGPARATRGPACAGP